MSVLVTGMGSVFDGRKSMKTSWALARHEDAFTVTVSFDGTRVALSRTFREQPDDPSGIAFRLASRWIQENERQQSRS